MNAQLPCSSRTTPAVTAAHIACLEVVEILVEHHHAVTHTDEMRVPNGADGDLVYLQQHGSKPVVRF